MTRPAKGATGQRAHVASSVEKAVLVLIKKQGEIDYAFSQAIEELRKLPALLERGRAEASQLLTEVADVECDLTGDTEATAPLFDELGLDDLANPDLDNNSEAGERSREGRSNAGDR